MTAESVNPATPTFTQSARFGTDKDDSFRRGRLPVGVRTIRALDTARNRLFPIEIWYPAAAQHAGQDMAPATQDSFTTPPSNVLRRQMAIRNAAAMSGTYPLVLFSHSSGGRRQQSTYLCTHLSSHGYIVAALDHSEAVASELAGQPGETAEQLAARVAAWIANRVPDIRFLLDHLLNDVAWDSEAGIDAARIGIVGHSFGGWTALAAPEVEGRIRAVVALAPAGSSQPPPNIIPAKLTFVWGRDVPTLYLVAEDDTALPLASMYELFERTRATKHMVILRRADHGHFADEFEQREGLCSAQQAHLIVRGLTLCHLDAALRPSLGAHCSWDRTVEDELAVRGLDARLHKP